MDMFTTRWKLFLVLLLAWAAIYLPGLGRQGLRGEEGRRVLPAVEMLKTGNWVLPRIADLDYYNKPPGINWLVAASFALTGEQSELTARLPSVIFAIIFVAFLMWVPATWLDTEARFIGAIVFLTTSSIIEKGRLIEIEMVYTALTGIAMLLWLSIWSRNSSSRLLWLAPSVVLAFGMLVKGPFIVLFFYCVVFAVLCYSKKLRNLFSIWHIVGCAIILLPFCTWLLLAFHQTSASKMSSQMTNQLLIRIIDKIDILYWGHNIMMEFMNFVPWLVFFPMLWNRRLTERIAPQCQPLFRGSRLGLVAGFIIISLMPKMESRYTMPVIPMVSVLLGWILSLEKEVVSTDRLWKVTLLAVFVVSCVTAAAGLIFVSVSAGTIIALATAICATIFVFLKRSAIRGKLALSLATMLLVAVLTLQYSTIILDISVLMEHRALMGTDINCIVPAGETVNLFRPGSFIYPAIFRLKAPTQYIHDANSIDEHVRYMLIKRKDWDVLSTQEKISARSPQVIRKFVNPAPDEYWLVRLE